MTIPKRKLLEHNRHSSGEFQLNDGQARESILKSFERFQSICELIPIVHPDQILMAEKARLRMAASDLGLSFVDESIFNLIDPNDVVEIYNLDEIQIYRNVRFLKLCSYSLLDLMVHSWSELYKKPSYATLQASRKVAQVISSPSKTISYDMPSFLQQEILLYAKTKRTFIVRPKYLSPLTDISTGNCGGFISTFAAEIHADGSDSQKYGILN